jgi:hypothetical protein
MDKVILLIWLVAITLLFSGCVMQDETYCEQDSDCACGRHIATGECFTGNKGFVNTTNPCPDFCSGIAGNLETKCIENKCVGVSKE